MSEENIGVRGYVYAFEVRYINLQTCDILWLGKM